MFSIGVDEMVALCQPDKVVWIDGSEEQLNALREEAISTGEMIKLNEEKLPGCLYHRTNPNDVARRGRQNLHLHQERRRRRPHQ